METVNEVLVLYDEFFVDELTIQLLYEKKDCVVEYQDENGNEIKKHIVMDWVLNQYYNHDKFLECRRKCSERRYETERQLYQYNEEYQRLVDEERLYILYLIGIEVTKVANIFGVSRQTVYKRIKSFEENRLQEFAPNSKKG